MKYIKAIFFLNGKKRVDLLLTVNQKINKKIFNFNLVDKIYFLRMTYKKDKWIKVTQPFFLDFLKKIFYDENINLNVDQYYSEGRFLKEFFNILIK